MQTKLWVTRKSLIKNCIQEDEVEDKIVMMKNRLRGKKK